MLPYSRSSIQLKGQMSEETTGKDTSANYSNCKIFVLTENIPLNSEKIFPCCIQFINKCHCRLSVALEAGKIL